ncbi:MAG: UDP-N-acetylmuramate--L-alanine ligase [Candidatus Omnitrophica bacterium]|nr:UDP-N-acetylmuramate--L-alanine ligase [Candidatus Omnitrophota bacterium]
MSKLNKQHHYHLIGIGGIGMGAIASLLLAKGYKVTGSDAKENDMVKNLIEQGAQISIGHDSSLIAGADGVVYSSAIKFDNQEIIYAKNKEIPLYQRADILAELMSEHIGITVAGAHGKTTTSSMTCQLLMKAGLQPTVAIGGIVRGLSANAKLGQGKYFVSEVDESDGSFLKFYPHYSLITNIDYEHLDYYKSWDNIIKAYKQFVANTHPDGIIIGCGEDENVMSLLKSSNRKFVTYGFSSDFDVSAQQLTQTDFSSSFHCFAFGKSLGLFELSLPGKHNIFNAMAVISLGLKMGVDLNIIKEGMKKFEGVQRRFQLIDNINNIKVIDDYAHHPTEIKMTLQAAERFKKERLIAVFQPHRYSRFNSLFDEFAEALKNCDYLIITDIYTAGESPIAGVTIERFEKLMREKTIKPVKYVEKEKLVQFISAEAKEGDMVLMLGAGDITKIAYLLAEELNCSRQKQTERV